MPVGELYQRALSNFGAEIGEGIAKSIEQHRKIQDKVIFDDAMLQHYASTPDPLDPTGKKMLLEPKKYLQLRQLNKDKFIAAAEAEMQWIDHSQKLRQSAAPLRQIMVDGQ